MADAREHGGLVLSGIFVSGSTVRMQSAMRKLTPDHFLDPSQSRLFGFMLDYFIQYAAIITERALDDMMRNDDQGRAALILETYQALLDQPALEDAEFQWSIDQVRELHSDRMTAEALADAMEIIRNGKTVDGETVKGGVEARSYLLQSLGQIDRSFTLQQAPEGDIRDEQKDIFEDYRQRHTEAREGLSRGILFGLDGLDEKIGGMQRGEIVLVAGFSSDGKSTLCIQTAWHTAIKQGKNVVFFTTETLRDQVRRKLISRHSMDSQFGIFAEGGLDSAALKSGTLTPPLIKKFREVATDLTTNPDYGRIYIQQVPRGSTLNTIEQSLASLQRKFDVDLVIMDYLALLEPTRRYSTQRESLASIMRESKQVATSFNDGQGVPLMSPWQVSREAREKADQQGFYTRSSMSETAEATNTSDVIVSMLAPIDNSERRVQIDMQILKARDSAKANNLRVDVDYATGWFRSVARFDTGTSSFGANRGSQSGSLDSLIQ